MSFSTTLGSFVGASAGKAAAYGKHAVLSSSVHAGNFGAAVQASASAAYAAKDAELALRREELNAARIGRGALPVPQRKAQRKLTA